MNQPVAIHELSSDLGLTSRTLRHWESEGLFQSLRITPSGRRLYDNDTVIRIRITMFLRKLDIPLKDIKSILDKRSFSQVREVILKQLIQIEEQNMELANRRQLLLTFLESITRNIDLPLDLTTLEAFGEFMEAHSNTRPHNIKIEEVPMNNKSTSHPALRFIMLPPMRTVYHTAVGISPEEEAMAPVLAWLNSANLIGTARIFGGNVKPMPRKENPEYGYGVCASIPEKVEIPLHLKEMRLPGGLYAMALSTDDIYGSWQALMKALNENPDYVPDHHVRLCLEEHIRNDNPDGVGNPFDLYLLEPVKRK